MNDRRREIDINEILMRVDNNNLYEKSALFIWGVLLYALSFSMFFSPNNIVTGGSTGLSIIIEEIFGMEESTFVLLFSLTFLAIGYLTLGRYTTIKTVCGVIILPIFMRFTSIFPNFIDISELSLFLKVFIGGIILGLGNGIIIRSGFSVGGFQTIYQILNKYFMISIGKATLIVNGTLVCLGCIFFGITNAMYAIIGLYVASVVTDKVMLETSASKTFFIVTKKSKEIKEYIIDILGSSATIINSRGGYSNDKQKIIMCAIPTRKYYEVKEIIEKIDEDSFFLITDTYEVFGGM